MGQLEFTDEVIEGWARLRSGEDMSGLAVIQRLVWSGRLAEELLERAAKAIGFRRRGDYEVLALLRRSEPRALAPLEVASQLLTSQSGMTGKLDRLESQGLLQRKQDPVDRRIVKLVLTDAGRDLADRAFVISLSLYNSILSGLELPARRNLDELLALVLRRLDELSLTREPWKTNE